MKLIKLECDHCGAPLTAEEGASSTICTFCGTPIVIDNGVRKIEYIDEAELLRVKIMQEEFLKKKAANEEFDAIKEQKKAQHKKWLKWAIIYHVICICWFPITMGIEALTDNAQLGSNLLMFLILMNMVCSIVLTLIKPIVPKNSWDLNEPGKAKQFVFFLVSSIAADLFGAIMIPSLLFP